MPGRVEKMTSLGRFRSSPVSKPWRKDHDPKNKEPVSLGTNARVCREIMHKKMRS
jgi:hypothetical protein